MNTKTTTKALLLFILLLPAYAFAAGLGELRLNLIEGDVQIKTADTSEWAPAVNNLPLRDGDQLWVPEAGRAEVQSRRGTIIRLDEKTALDILTVDNDALQFYLSTGLAYVNAKGERDTTLQMDTPLSSIRVYTRAKFSAGVSNDGDTDISVYLGSISAETKKGETTVEAGKMLALGRDSTDLSPLGSIDAWERWNGDQDRAIEEPRPSVRYLPAELTGYARDFDDNGEWVDMPTYGHVWRPTLHIGVDWSPYRHGRWIWIGDDYVWIASERWGWAPYHYGRWSFIESRWCWVPPARHEVYWGPGYVGWVRTPTYVSWVPLAPREVYYGHGYYGPHSVNINRVDINKVVIKNVYKNVHVENSVTTIHNDTFIRGKKVDFKVHENPFLKEKISVGRPQIKPERASRRPDIREIPTINQPPDRVKDVKIEEVKKQRHLAKNRDKSVFTPERAPQTLAVEEKKDPSPRVPRKAKLKEEEARRVAPQRIEEAPPAPTPAERQSSPPELSTPPPEGRQEGKQRQPAVEGRSKNREEASSQTQRQETPPSPPRDMEQPPSTERESPPPELSTPPPESRQEGKQRQQPAVEGKSKNRDEASSQMQRQETPPSPPRDLEQPPPTERESPPPELSTPPPESRQEGTQRQQPAVKDRSGKRDEASSQMQRQETPPPPRELARPTPVERELPPPELSTPPPVTRRQERQQRTQPEADGRSSIRDEASSQMHRQETPPPAREEAQPIPAETRKEVQNKGAKPKPKRKKVGEKEEPVEPEGAPPEKPLE